MMRSKTQKRLLIGVCSFSLIAIIGIIYAAFTQNLNTNGTGISRKSNFDIYFNNVSNFLTTGTASVTTSTPTAQSHTTVIEDYEATLATPGDSIYFTFDIVNDGDYDATLTSLTLGPVKCSVNGNGSDVSATNVCNNIEYTMKYTDSNSNVSINDTLASKETKEVKVTLTYKDFSDSSKLPTSNVTISNLGIDMVYTADSEAKTNSDGSTPKMNAVQSLLAKSNDVSATYTSGSETSHQMYAFEHPATEQTGALIDYRYIGNDPYNYVDLNGETWRIIGIFTVKNGEKEEQRIKIIKDENISGGDYKWDLNQSNDWINATLNIYLNGDYYEGLSNIAKEMIEPAETYLGGRAYDSTTHFGTASDMYAWERGTTVYSGHSITDTKNITVAYPSDYTYTYAKGVDNTCYSDGNKCYTNGGGTPSSGWMYKSYSWWFVSPRSDGSYYAFRVHSGGYVYSTVVDGPYGVRPVVYLISDISFEGNHTGSSSDHYRLKI